MARNEIHCVKAFIEAINRQDISALSRLMAEDYRFVDSRGQTVSGREAMMAAWKEYFRLFPDYKIEVENLVHGKECLAVFGSATGTYNGKRGPVPENRITMPAAWKAVVQNGRIKHWQVYADWTEGWRIIEKDRRQV
jgi:ketosteroid isomerase-like protein